MFDEIAQAVKDNKNVKGMIIVVLYYFTSRIRFKCDSKLKLLIFSPFIVFYKFVTDIVLGCEIPVSTKIGSGLIIHHGRCLVLNKSVVIGNNVTIKHNTTIGNKEDMFGVDMGSPCIGDNVSIGPNTVIIGPIKIGDNAIIGAGSVVVKDVDANTIVAGNPAKLIRILS